MFDRILLSILKNTSKSLTDVDDGDEEEDGCFNSKSNSNRCRSMHLRHNEKKYHVEFLKKSLPDKSTSPRHLRLPDKRIQPKNIESLFETETSISTTANGPSTNVNSPVLHRESRYLTRDLRLKLIEFYVLL